jgi:hypothetical protein
MSLSVLGNCFKQASSAKFLKEPEAINFGAYQKKLKFTGSAVQALEVRNA